MCGPKRRLSLNGSQPLVDAADKFCNELDQHAEKETEVRKNVDIFANVKCRVGVTSEHGCFAGRASDGLHEIRDCHRGLDLEPG